MRSICKGLERRSVLEGIGLGKEKEVKQGIRVICQGRIKKAKGSIFIRTGVEDSPDSFLIGATFVGDNGPVPP